MSNSYRQILRSSSIMGGAQALKYIAGLVSMKAVAILLGPSGVGIIGLYTSATNLLGVATGFGLQSSAVRVIAQADGQDDPKSLARAAIMLRRLCWATGFLGWIACVAIALPLSRWMFENDNHVWAISLLGAVLLLNALSNGQLALLQGMRRVGDIARVQISASVVNVLIAVTLYALLGKHGVVPVLILNSAVSLAFSWWAARRVQLVPATMDWLGVVAEARPMLRMGMAFVWSGLLTAGLELFTRMIISRLLGVDAAGLYQAAWAMSGMFAAFVLTAMGTDFYPRLTAVIHDRETACRTVNEQVEIGILISLPGLLATIALANWLVVLLFSAKFAAAAEVLVWMVLGVFGRVLAFPMSYIQLALGAGRWFVATELAFVVIQVLLIAWLVPACGVVGAGYAFALLYAMYTIGMACLGYWLIGYRWSPTVRRMMVMSTIAMVFAVLLNRHLPAYYVEVAGITLTATATVVCLRALAQRLGQESALAILIKKLSIF